MAISVNGTTFNKRKVAAANDRVVRNSLFIDDAILQGCGVTYSGLNISVAAGDMILHGGHVQTPGGSLALEQISGGQLYCLLVCTIDLTKTNTATSCGQVFFEVLQDSTGYPTPTQENIDGLTGNPTMYQVPFARFIQTASGITSWADVRPGERFELTGTLPSNGTSLTLSDPRIRNGATVEVLTSVYGRPPQTVTVNNGSIAMTFVAKSGAMDVKVRFS